MTYHVLKTPVTEGQVRGLTVGDQVTLQGTLFGIRDATQIHMFDRGRKTKFDLTGHALVHTAPNVRKVEPSDAAPAGYESICVGTTTSMRMERFTRPLIQEYGARIIIGKGGLGEDSRRAFQDLGGVYLAVVGGAAALETTWIDSIEDVDMDDLYPESLWKFKINNFGPLLVAMDAHGGNLYQTVSEDAAGRREAALASMGVVS